MAWDGSWPSYRRGKPGSKYLTTKVKVSTVSYTWKIEDIFTRLQTDRIISSDHFGEESWLLQLQNKDESRHDEPILSLTLRMPAFARRVGQKKPRQAKACFNAWILNANQQKSNVYEDHDTFRKLVEGDGHTVTKFVSREDLLNKAKGLVEFDEEGQKGSLTIECEVFILSGGDDLDIHLGDQLSPPCLTVPRWDVADKLGTVLREALFSDVTITADGRNFPVHRAILAVHSPVFRAMFENNMKENREKSVEIKDCSGEAVDAMLHFMYTGEVFDINKLASELLAAADKYDVTSLKAVCEEQLARDLNVDNASDILVLSKLHGAEQLKASALYWIARHVYDVMKTEGWKLISREHHDLMEATLEEVANFTQNLTEPPGKRLKTV